MSNFELFKSGELDSEGKVITAERAAELNKKSDFIMDAMIDTVVIEFSKSVIKQVKKMYKHSEEDIANIKTILEGLIKDPKWDCESNSNIGANN